jgi:hypothetical protein
MAGSSVDSRSRAGLVFVITTFLFQALDEVSMDRWVQLLEERFVQVVDTDQINHVAEIVMTPGR